MAARELAVLALCIAEYDTVLTHLRSLERVGHAVPYGVQGRVSDELAYLCLQWSNLHGEGLFARDTDMPRIISEVRSWCTAHQSEIDALTNDN